MQIRTEDLKIGDTIKVFWKPGSDTITRIDPYEGSLSHIMHGVARFALNPVGMSLARDEVVDVTWCSYNARRDV